MDKTASNSHTSPKAIKDNDNELEQGKSLAKSKPRTHSQQGSKTAAKKVLGRKEKLAAVRKANQALMRALELRSQHNSSTADAQGDV